MAESKQTDVDKQKGGIDMASMYTSEAHERQFGGAIDWLRVHGYDYHGGADKLHNGTAVSMGVWVHIDAAHTLEAYLRYINRYAPIMGKHTYSF